MLNLHQGEKGLFSPLKTFSKYFHEYVFLCFCQRKALGQAHLLDTLNMFVKFTEIFVEASKKSFGSNHEILSEYSNSILSFIFSKSQLFSLFLSYNLIGVLCGYDFFTEANT